MEVTIVNDGRFALPAEVFAPDVDQQERERYLRARHLPMNAIPVQLCPVTGTERVLIDTGMGPGPTSHPIPDGLRGASRNRHRA